MTTIEIITELKALGLDPAQPDIAKLDDDRIFALMNELGSKKGDPDAGNYLAAMNEAINRLDGAASIRETAE